MKDVLICQKKILRSITGLKLDSCKDSFKNLRIVTVFGMYFFEICVYIFNGRQSIPVNLQLQKFNTRTKNKMYAQSFSNLSVQ